MCAQVAVELEEAFTLALHVNVRLRQRTDTQYFTRLYLNLTHTSNIANDTTMVNQL